MIQFDEHIFQTVWNHQLDGYFRCNPQPSFPDGFHSLSRPVVALIHPAILIPWKGFPNKNP